MVITIVMNIARVYLPAPAQRKATALRRPEEVVIGIWETAGSYALEEPNRRSRIEERRLYFSIFYLTTDLTTQLR